MKTYIGREKTPLLLHYNHWGKRIIKIFNKN